MKNKPLTPTSSQTTLAQIREEEEDHQSPDPPLAPLLVPKSPPTLKYQLLYHLFLFYDVNSNSIYICIYLYIYYYYSAFSISTLCQLNRLAEALCQGVKQLLSP